MPTAGKKKNNGEPAGTAIPPGCLGETGDGVLLAVHVQPKAANNRVAGLHGGALKLAITAPPVEGKANAAVVTMVARLFGLAKSAVMIRSGQQSRSKKVLLSGIGLNEARLILARLLAAG